MHDSHGKRYTQHLSTLSALTPSYVTRSELDEQLQELNTTVFPGTVTPFRCFNNIALLNTDCYRAEILHNVDKILERYQGDFTMPDSDQSAQIEKDVLWASMQLFAHLQTIEQEIGLQIEPKAAYAKSLGKLESCQAILRKNRSHLPDLTGFLRHKPIVLNVDSDQWYEKAFKDFIQYMDDRNNTRLFWVWGGPNLDLALEYAGQANAREQLAETTYLPGQISWSLYLFRGTFFALKWFNVWWNNPKWLKELESLTKEQRAEYRTRYLIAYWDVYKYRILNDYVWGPINLIVFEWWTGAGIWGWLGDFATCFLLCMDVYLAELTFAEEQRKYLENHRQYSKQLDALTQKIKLLKVADEFDSLDALDKITHLHEYFADKSQRSLPLTAEEAALAVCLNAWNEEQRSQQDHEQRWKKKEKFLQLDCIYTKVLLVAFAMCTSLLMGGILPLVVSVFLVKTGTMLCLALTIFYRTIRAQMQITGDKEERTALQAQEKSLFKEFHVLKVSKLETPDRDHDKRMHDLYLHLLNIGKKINYQTDSIHYQYLELARTTLLRFLIPSVIGLTLVYAPATFLMVPTYVFVLAASAAFAYALDQFAKARKPDEVHNTSQLNLAQYQTFFKAPKVYSKQVEDSCLYRPSCSFA